MRGTNAGGVGAVSAGATVTVSTVTPGCTVQDVTWPRGLNFTIAPLINMTSDMAWKVPASYFSNKTQGAYSYGTYEFYELGVEVNHSIAATPCTYQPAPPATACQAVLSANGVIDRNYISATSPAPPSGYCQLPVPSSDGFFYVNVRATNPNILGSFYLLFD